MKMIRNDKGQYFLLRRSVCDGFRCLTWSCLSNFSLLRNASTVFTRKSATGAAVFLHLSFLIKKKHQLLNNLSVSLSCSQAITKTRVLEVWEKCDYFEIEISPLLVKFVKLWPLFLKTLQFSIALALKNDKCAAFLLNYKHFSQVRSNFIEAG